MLDRSFWLHTEISTTIFSRSIYIFLCVTVRNVNCVVNIYSIVAIDVLFSFREKRRSYVNEWQYMARLK
jgi:hypothetical protein